MIQSVGRNLREPAPIGYPGAQFSAIAAMIADDRLIVHPMAAGRPQPGIDLATGLRPSSGQGCGVKGY